MSLFSKVISQQGRHTKYINTSHKIEILSELNDTFAPDAALKKERDVQYIFGENWDTHLQLLPPQTSLHTNIAGFKLL